MNWTKAGRPIERDAIIKIMGESVQGGKGVAMKRKAAEILTEKTGDKWTPDQIQKTIWSWAKTLYEHASAALMAALSPQTGVEDNDQGL